MKNRFIAAGFAIAFGWLGFHKFYLGKWIQGILYILFMPLTVWIALLEGVLYLVNSQEWFDITFNGEYMRNEQYLNNKKRNGN